MRNPATGSVGLVVRKACALALAYCFCATSLWSVTLPTGQPASDRSGRAASVDHFELPSGSHAGNPQLADLLNKIQNPSAASSERPVAGPVAMLHVPVVPPVVKAAATVAMSTTTVNIFGPTQFVRTTGPPNQYTVTVTVPASVVSPFNLHIQNGDPSGSNRVSSASIYVNGTQVASPSDFNQNVASLDRAVTLTAQTTLQVNLASKPGSYLILNLGGQSADHTAPVITIAAPVANAVINTPQTHFDIRYQDVPGAGEPAASGVNITTLKVLLDGVDRTSLFTKRTDEATADLPATLALAPGAHTLAVSIQDNAGNTGQASEQFQIDTTPPTLQILQPVAGNYLNNTTPQIQLVYSDNVGINTASLKVTINGVDRSSLFTKTAGGASATLTTPLPQGANQIVATISDQAGNSTTASSAFNIDTTPPVISIVHPGAASRHGSATVEFLIQYSDDQAVDLSTLQVAMDGTALAVTPAATTVAGSTTLADGNHTLTASIKDKAGNQASTSSAFSVDTKTPDIHILQPAPGAILNNVAPPIQVQFSDNDIDTTTLRVSIDGVDRTSLFTISGSSATATSPALADGSHTIAAQIKDLTGNLGQTSNSLLIDTIKPQLTIVSPSGPINTRTPSALAQYSDSGSGIDPASVHVVLDGVDVTATFSVAVGSTTGVLGGSGLSEGAHQLQVTVADKAGNVAQATASFVVDVTAPLAAFTSPANNSFINTTQPALTLTYSDSGAGVDANSIHIFLQQGNTPESEITSLFTLGAGQASAAIPASSALTTGTYHLRAQVADRAGNSTTATSAFAVDVTPPTYSIQSPAANSFLNTATPAFAVTYQDDSSGVDPSKFVLTVDGVDRTNRLTVTATGASGALQSGDALADGTHQVSVVVIDRAGNQAPVVPQPFLVDTTPPTISITAPLAASYTNINRPAIAVSYADSGSGIDPTSFRLSIDGVDHTAEFTATATGASGSPVAVLSDGPHVITASIRDLAANLAAATTPLSVDTVPPTITGSITPVPNAAGWNNSDVTVSFVCTDDNSGVASCSDPVTLSAEGAQNVTGTATDRAGNKTQTLIPVKIDRTPPVITATAAPPANAAGWNMTDVLVTFNCSDSLSGIATCPAPATVSTEGKNQPVPGTATDKAGNTASATVTLNIEKTAPTITAKVNPAPNAAGWNNSDVTVSFVCAPSVSDIVTCQPPVTVSTEGKAQNISGAVTDQAGKTASATAVVNLDKTAPLITATPAPAPNAAGWNNTDVVISYFCSDSLSGIAICPPSATVSTEGSAQKISAQATDIAGNTASVTSSLNIDKTPPTITVSAAPPANGAGWNNSNVTLSYLCTDSLSGVASCPGSTVVASEGQNQNISAQATDVAGNVATGTISLSIDKTPPTIVQLSTPDHISRLHPGQITATVTDNFTVAQVIISVNGTPLGTFSSAPYQAALQAPAGANPGDTLTVTAVATDEAGNTQAATRGVRVAADGVVVGQVLSDVTSFPVQGASVQAISRTSSSDQTDDHGRYSLQVSDAHLFLSVSGATPPTTTVEREVFVQDNVGTVPVDARLTPLAAPLAVGAAGGTVTASPVSIVVPAGAVSDGTTFQVTPLSGQGLPGLLPLGWSPLAAFDLRASSPVANLSASVAQMPNVVAHLVTYNPALHAWTMVSPNLQPASGSVSFTVPAAGDYALVVADATTPPVAVPSINSPLTGIDMQLLSSSAVSSGSLSPAILPPSGGTATATLGVQSSTFVPSGTVIQANLSEKFSLKSGDVVSQETRSEDIVLYNALAPANTTLGAQFPVSPSRKFANAELITGKVHLDILAGREGVRGQPGGSDPLTLSDGNATLSVPGGALSEDTAISVQSVATEDFVPTNGSLGALQEVLVDFSGEALNTAAQLSIPSTGLNPSHTFLLTAVERLDGVPRIVVVALAQINGNSLTSVASAGLPGITQGGAYVFYDFPSPIGFVTGVASSTAGPVQALVQTDSLPIVSITGANGVYVVPALVGTVNLKASAPHTALAGSATAQVTAGQSTQVNIPLAGTVTAAVVSPADGSLAVPVSTVITVTTTAPINPQSIQQSNLQLFKGPVSANQLVPLQAFVLSTSGTVLSFAPQSNLDPAVQYTVQVAGLADSFGGAISVPSSTFTTKAAAVFNFDPNQITFSFPDQNGNIHVSALAGSLRPGTKVLIVDQSNSVVLSLTALNDGSLSGNFPGTLNDVLQVTVTDPNGAVASFTRSQFVAADGSVAVGPGGGTVTGPGGVELRIPEGALDKGVTFKVESFGPDLFPERPDVPGGTFGGGLKITAGQPTTFKKEAKLAFPRPPDAPAGAFFQVYGRLQAPNGQVAFEDLDYALPEGQGSTAKVVTASFPFRGMIGFNELMAQADYQGQSLDINPAFGAPPLFSLGFQEVAFIIWEASNLLPGVALGGAVTGRVRYPVPAGGTLPDGTINRTGDTVFVGVPNIQVTVDPQTSSHALPPNSTVAFTQPDGSFTFSDPRYNGGTIGVIAYDGNGHAVLGKAIETVALTDKTVDEFAGPLLPFYKNLAFADIVVPAPVPPPPTPQIGISLFTEDASSNPPGQRVPVTGIVASGTPLVIAFKTNGQISNPPNVTINQVSYPSQKDQPAVPGDRNTLDFELTQPFTPNLPGVYTITATGVTPFLTTITASRSFMVVAAGGSTNQIIPGKPPEIVAVSPTAGSTGVPVDTFVQVTFSEPVTNLAGNVSLLPADGSASPPIRLSGFSYLDLTNSNPISSLSATDAVSSLTIQPLTGLKFGLKYTLQITSNVVDLDNVADPNKPALALVQPQTPWDFTTFGPQVLGGTPAFSSSRAVVFGDRAYVSTTGLQSQVRTFNISDPTAPVEIPASTARFIGRATDVAGEENSALIGGGNLLAVTAGFASGDLLIPSNMWLYNVSGDQMTRVGGVSVTSSAINVGQAMRLAVKGNFAYVGVMPGGIEVIDLQQVISDYNQVFPNGDPRQFAGIVTDGQGFANDAIINNIPVKDSAGQDLRIFGIQAGDFVLPGSDPQNPTTQTFVVATGIPLPTTSPNPISFVVADPTQPAQSALVYTGRPQLGASMLTSGYALTLGQLTDSILDVNGNPVVKPVAVVVGLGAAPDPANPGQTMPYVLAVMDMTVPSAPTVMSMLGLPAFPSDVLLRNTTALVGTAQNEVLLVNLIDPRNPVNAGAIKNSIFGDRLAITKDGVLLGTSFDGNRGGIQTATLGVVPKIQVDAGGLLADVNGRTSEDILINYNIVGDLSQVASAQIQVKDDTGNVVFSTPVPVKATGSVTWPVGQPIHVTPDIISFQVQNPDGGVSDFVEAASEDASTSTSGSAPTPVILSALPNKIVVNSPQQVIEITGRNFLTATQAQFIPVGSDVGDSTKLLPVDFVSSRKVRLTLTPDYFLQVNDATLRLLNGASQSNDYTVHVVPAGLPPGPMLVSIDPSQIPLPDSPQDIVITLTGANFVAGDTVVKTGANDPNVPTELAAQVISATSMQLTIPAAWQISPATIPLYVQSTQFPILMSDPLDFQIGDGIPLAQLAGSSNQITPTDNGAIITDRDPIPAQPVPPVLTSVGDGFVPLAASDATQATEVTLQGSGFQSGGTVAVSVDGFQTMLTPDSVSDSQIQLKLPPSLFKLRTYTFDLQVNLQNGNPGQHPPHAHQQNNSGKVIFRDQPLYAAKGPNYRLGGFHRRSPNKNDPNVGFDYYLMVPEQSNCAPPSVPPCSKAVAVIGQHVLQPKGTKVTFDPDPALINVAPPSTKSPIATLTVTGKDQNQDHLQKTDIIANKDVAAKPQDVKTPVGKLQAQLLRHRHYTVFLHYITNIPDPQHPPGPNTPCANLPLAPANIPGTKALYDQRAQSLETTLNHIYNQQANVQWDVTPVQGNAGTCVGEVIPQQVHYDLDGDGNLDRKHNNEINAIVNAFPHPQLPAGIDGQKHIYFVRSFLIRLRLKDVHVPGGFKVGSPYAMTFNFDGGVAPYHYNNNVAGTNLPPGIGIASGNNSVRISGTPTADGVGIKYGYEFSVTDSDQPATTISIIVNFPKLVAAPGSIQPQWGIPQGDPNPTGFVEAFAVTIGGENIMADDRTPIPNLIQHVLPHELGHTLGMNHPSENPQAVLNPEPPNHTCIPNLAAVDSDYSDPDQMMWWLDLYPKKRQAHIGIQQLWQLNGNLGTNCQ
jgi:hypothetical protein